jgi:hypothetical protein
MNFTEFPQSFRRKIIRDGAAKLYNINIGLATRGVELT